MVGIIGGMADSTSRLSFATHYVSIHPNRRCGRLTFARVRCEVLEQNVFSFLSHVLIIPVGHKKGDLQEVRDRWGHYILELIAVLCGELTMFKRYLGQRSRTTRVCLSETMQRGNCVPSEFHEVRLFEARLEEFR